MPNIYLSIIIPVYNEAAKLKHCLINLKKALEKVSYAWEIIVVDDHSSDNSVSVAQEFADHSSIPILIIQQEKNLGPAASRNTGAEAAKGKVLLFLDADVLIPENALCDLVKAFSLHPEVVAVQGIYGSKIPYSNVASQYKNLYYHFIFSKILKDPYLTSAGTFFLAIAKDIFIQIGKFDAAIPKATIEDYDLAYRLTQSGSTTGNIGNKILLAREIAVIHDRKYDLRDLLKYDFRLTVAKIKFFLRNLTARGYNFKQKVCFFSRIHKIDVSLGSPAQMWSVIANLPVSILIALHLVSMPWLYSKIYYYLSFTLTILVFLFLHHKFWHFLSTLVKDNEHLTEPSESTVAANRLKNKVFPMLLVVLPLKIALITWLDGITITMGIFWGLIDFLLLRKRY